LPFSSNRFRGLRLFVIACMAGTAGLTVLPARAEDGARLQNWFNDPFLRMSNDIPGCPQARGPYMTEAERNAEAHSRIERGTSCWMAGTCTEPNAYRYDAPIAAAIGSREDKDVFRGSSLWLTVQRRFVRVEGCVASQGQAEAIERWLSRTPDVERIIVQVMQGSGGKPPYRTMEAAK
jgi:hypothetical protein